MYLLKFSNKNFLRQDYLASQVSPYIDIKNGKKRLIEPPTEELKRIQRNLKIYLSDISVPFNVFSGVKGRSYVNNSRYHLGNKYLFKMDITGFFPSITRDRVYRFFFHTLKTSPDIAEILTNMTTINLENCSIKDSLQLYSFLEDKGINTYNHLISGAPTSQILSYLVNTEWLNEIQILSNKNNIIFTIYVDDLVFSSSKKIPNNFKYKVFKIVKRNGYSISLAKTKCYSRNYPKLVTGVIINSNGKLTIKNSLHQKIYNEFSKLKDDSNNKESYLRLVGLIAAARQINPNAFPSIFKYLNSNKEIYNTKSSLSVY
jgi:Reverse transcriptase (RNA-dependent DNA polymerase).